MFCACKNAHVPYSCSGEIPVSSQLWGADALFSCCHSRNHLRNHEGLFKQNQNPPCISCIFLLFQPAGCTGFTLSGFYKGGGEGKSFLLKLMLRLSGMIPAAETQRKALKIVRVMIKLQEQEVLPLRGVGRNLNLYAFINLASEVKLLFLGCCFFHC